MQARLHMWATLANVISCYLCLHKRSSAAQLRLAASADVQPLSNTQACHWTIWQCIHLCVFPPYWKASRASIPCRISRLMYMCRQMITLNTYANFHNRVLNDALMFASAVDGLMTTVAATTIAAKSIIAAVCVAGHLVPFSSLRRAPVV